MTTYGGSFCLMPMQTLQYDVFNYWHKDMPFLFQNIAAPPQDANFCIRENREIVNAVEAVYDIANNTVTYTTEDGKVVILDNPDIHICHGFTGGCILISRANNEETSYYYIGSAPGSLWHDMPATHEEDSFNSIEDLQHKVIKMNSPSRSEESTQLINKEDL